MSQRYPLFSTNNDQLQVLVKPKTNVVSVSYIDESKLFEKNLMLLPRALSFGGRTDALLSSEFL